MQQHHSDSSSLGEGPLQLQALYIDTRMLILLWPCVRFLRLYYSRFDSDAIVNFDLLHTVGIDIAGCVEELQNSTGSLRDCFMIMNSMVHCLTKVAPKHMRDYAPPASADIRKKDLL
ncbi:unnamed protein product [Peronospora belbahrii]|uniref:Uncharacterized protein n=1 Tax=Peronospora belbahrii TaxID=622444 RepID=A0ABN8CVH5_9STRA|nr:unnamed protein product [Peronospora belbahrii]